MRKILGAAAALALTAGVAAEAQSDGQKQWREMGPGAHFAPAQGDWEKGAHSKFIRLAAGLDVPFHTHSNDYHGVMLSGRMTIDLEGGKTSEVGAGDYWTMKGGVPHGHKCLSAEPCLLYTHGDKNWDYAPHPAQ